MKGEFRSRGGEVECSFPLGSRKEGLFSPWKGRDLRGVERRISSFPFALRVARLLLLPLVPLPLRNSPQPLALLFPSRQLFLHFFDISSS